MKNLTIESAKQFLKDNGYFVDNLWCIDDVKGKYDCTDEQAQGILESALTNEATMEQIQFSINEFAEIENLVEKVEKFARKDTKTGKGMNEGFCFGDGEAYFEEEEDAETHAISLGYKNLKEAYRDEAYYFTEWEVEEGETWYDADGNEFNN